jgi:hypothetical protein
LSRSEGRRKQAAFFFAIELAFLDLDFALFATVSDGQILSAICSTSAVPQFLYLQLKPEVNRWTS